MWKRISRSASDTAVFHHDLRFSYGSGRLLKQRFRNPFRLCTQLRHGDGLPKCSAQQWTKSKEQAGSLAVARDDGVVGIDSYSHICVVRRHQTSPEQVLQQ